MWRRGRECKITLRSTLTGWEICPTYTCTTLLACILHELEVTGSVKNTFRGFCSSNGAGENASQATGQLRDAISVRKLLRRFSLYACVLITAHALAVGLPGRYHVLILPVASRLLLSADRDQH